MKLKNFKSKLSYLDINEKLAYAIKNVKNAINLYPLKKENSALFKNGQKIKIDSQADFTTKKTLMSSSKNNQAENINLFFNNNFKNLFNINNIEKIFKNLINKQFKIFEHNTPNYKNINNQVRNEIIKNNTDYKIGQFQINKNFNNNTENIERSIKNVFSNITSKNFYEKYMYSKTFSKNYKSKNNYEIKSSFINNDSKYISYKKINNVIENYMQNNFTKFVTQNNNNNTDFEEEHSEYIMENVDTEGNIYNDKNKNFEEK